MLFGNKKFYARLQETQATIKTLGELLEAIVQKPRKVDRSFEDYYTIVRSLDSSSGGSQVILAEDKQSKRKVAAKYYECGNLTAALNEISALRLLAGHPNVIKLLDVFNLRSPSGDKLALILEFASHGDLLDHLYEKPKERLDDNEAVKIFTDIVNGVREIHAKNLAHSDLKLNNVLLHDNRSLICDFGLVEFVNSSGKSTRFCGTPVYMSPELIACHNAGGTLAYDPKISDIWSLGVILFIMYYGELPFDQEDEDDLMNAIVHDEINWPRLNSPGSAMARDLLEKILQRDPQKRISLEEISNHAWMKRVWFKKPM